VLYLKALTGMPLEGLRKTTQNGRKLDWVSFRIPQE
jgi:hypothetical protein